ncbi:SWIM zinc finger family protein, partial [Aquimarina celericrescens]|nr:SWIM zinc finger family protein [Aquimarina celericrescens]
DLKNKVYRARELKREGIDIDALRFSSDTDKEAYKISQQEDGVRNIEHKENQEKITITGVVDKT